jgi:hypothetical protein
MVEIKGAHASCKIVNTLYNVAQWQRYNQGSCFSYTYLRLDNDVAAPLTQDEQAIIDSTIQRSSSLEMTPSECLPDYLDEEERQALRNSEEQWWWESCGGTEKLGY